MGSIAEASTTRFMIHGETRLGPYMCPSLKTALLLAVAIVFVLTGRMNASPMEFGELTFNLKHGLSSADLVDDVKRRKLVATPTEEQLAQLKRLGASPELLSVVAAPGNVLGAKESETFLREKEIASQEHFWVIGTYIAIKDGKMLVTCLGPVVRKIPPAQYVGNVVLTGSLPVMFKVNETSDIRAVNCEARKTGDMQIQNQQNQVETVPVMEVVRDLGKPVAVPKTEALTPTQAPKRHEAVITEGQWYHLSDEKSLPGGGPDLWLMLVSSDQFTVHFLFSQSGPARVPDTKFDIKKGLEETGDNLTIIVKDPKWTVYWKDTAGAFPGTGVIVLVQQ